MESQNELKAPQGKYRVIGVDTFESMDADYLIGDFESKEEALKVAEKRGGEMNPTYVYDDTGKEISGGFGTF